MTNVINTTECKNIINENTEFFENREDLVLKLIEKYSVELTEAKIIDAVNAIDRFYVGTYNDIESFFNEELFEKLIYPLVTTPDMERRINFIKNNVDFEKLYDEFIIIQEHDGLYVFENELEYELGARNT